MESKIWPSFKRGASPGWVHPPSSIVHALDVFSPSLKRTANIFAPEKWGQNLEVMEIPNLEFAPTILLGAKNPRKRTWLHGKNNQLKMYFLVEKLGFSNVVLVFRGEKLLVSGRVCFQSANNLDLTLHPGSNRCDLKDGLPWDPWASCNGNSYWVRVVDAKIIPGISKFNGVDEKTQLRVCIWQLFCDCVLIACEKSFCEWFQR